MSYHGWRGLTVSSSAAWRTLLKYPGNWSGADVNVCGTAEHSTGPLHLSPPPPAQYPPPSPPMWGPPLSTHHPHLPCGDPRSVPTTLTSHVGTPAQYPLPSPPMWGPPLSTHYPHLPCGDPRSVPTTLTSHVGTLAQYPPPSPPMWGPPLSIHHPHLPCGDPRSVPTTLTSHVGTLAQYPPPSPPKWGPPLSTHHPHLPSGDPLSKLLIDHDSNGEDVGSSGLGRVKGRPEQLLQVLAELKELHLEDWEAEDRAGTNTHMCECISTSVCMCLCTFVPCDEIDVCVMHCEVTAYPWGSSSL